MVLERGQFTSLFPLLFLLAMLVCSGSARGQASRTPEAPKAFATPGARSASAAPEEWKRIVAAARKEGSVVLYSSHADTVTSRMKEDFHKAYPGIRLVTARFAGGALISRVDQERKNNADGADVTVSADVGYYLDRLSEGLIRSPQGPSMETWPGRYLIRGAIPIVQFEVMVMSYNTNLVKTPLKSYTDLLKPELKGRVGLSDLAAIPILAWYDWLDRAFGPDFTAKLAAQQPRLYAGAVPTAQAVASGEIGVSGFANLGSTLPLIEQGAPVKVVVPKPAFGYANGMSLLGWAKRPNAAQVLVDYLTSVRGQSMLAAKGEMASPRPNIPRSLDASAIEVFDNSPYTPEVVNARRQKWTALFKK